MRGMREVERSAASVEEAIEAALEELGVSEQEVEIEIVQEPRAGLLGLGGRQAVVKVRLREGGGGPPAVASRQGEVAAEFLRGLLALMEVPAEVDLQEVEGTLYVDVWGGGGGEGMGLLIGKRGQTLEGLQELVRGAVQRRTASRCLVIVDVEDYRKRRRSHLAAKAREAARRVSRTGREEALEPMNAYERKIVHDAVASVRGVVTESEGDEPERRVVIRRQRGGRGPGGEAARGPGSASKLTQGRAE